MIEDQIDYDQNDCRYPKQPAEKVFAHCSLLDFEPYETLAIQQLTLNPRHRPIGASLRQAVPTAALR